ncbi:MAG: hypothetical protein U9M92_00810, partial [Patescibacteria group bacterium]|nr:hypothetical protein [Patescibacteria group bacterium]
QVLSVGYKNTLAGRGCFLKTCNYSAGVSPPIGLAGVSPPSGAGVGSVAGGVIGVSEAGVGWSPPIGGVVGSSIEFVFVKANNL